MIQILPVLPILVPILFAVLFLLFRRQLRFRAAQWNVFANTGLFATSIFLWLTVWKNGTQVIAFGQWQPPFGIVFVADLFAASMVLMTGLLGFCVSLYLLAEKSKGPISMRYLIVKQALMMGVCGSFLTGDIFNLYVWFEVMLMSSFVLMVFEGSKAQLEGTLKYLVLNLVGSFFFLISIGLLYAAAGTLNMAHLAQILAQNGSSTAVQAAYGLLIVAFGMKAGVFPLFFWLPASYHTPRIATSALLAGLLTKVGIYGLFRTSTLLFPNTLSWHSDLFLWLGCLTMITGVLGAAFHYDIRRILSFHIISQIGYIVLGLAIWTQDAMAGAIFYLFHHMIVKTNLFFFGGIIQHLKGSTHLKFIGGLFKERKAFAFLFLIPALSLAGLPPLSGFFAKFSLIRAGLSQQFYLTIAVVLVVGLITLYSMTKIWIEAFWKPQPENFAVSQHPKNIGAFFLPVILLALVTVSWGLFPQILFKPANRIVHELLNPSIYIQSVFGKELL